MPNKNLERIQKALEDYQPGQRKGDVVPVVELAMLAHLLKKHRAHVTVYIADGDYEFQINQVDDATSEINPHIYLRIT